MRFYRVIVKHPKGLLLIRENMVGDAVKFSIYETNLQKFTVILQRCPWINLKAIDTLERLLPGKRIQ